MMQQAPAQGPKLPRPEAGGQRPETQGHHQLVLAIPEEFLAAPQLQFLLPAPAQPTASTIRSELLLP